MTLEETVMIIANKAVLVTGANRGIGRALVEEALRRGAKRVYAGTRQPLAHPDGRVTPLTLDITNKEQIQRAVKEVESLDVLVNNAGVALVSEMGDRVSLEEHLAINLFGPYDVTQAFLPLLIRSRVTVVNNLSSNAVGPGLTDTDALDATLTDDVKKVCISRTPLGRLGTLSDIADVVAFLASPDARWVTGHTLFATGGFMP